MELQERDLYILFFCNYPIFSLGLPKHYFKSIPDSREIQYVMLKLLSQRTTKSVKAASHLALYLAKHRHLSIEDGSGDSERRLGCLLHLLDFRLELPDVVKSTLSRCHRDLFNRFLDIGKCEPISLVSSSESGFLTERQYVPEVNDHWRVYGAIELDFDAVFKAISSN